MVEMVFFLRFQSQLRRTRPELISFLEDTVVRAAEEAGGKITTNHSFVRAAFDEDSPGFWLDILMMIETLIKAADGASADLYGYSLLLGKTLPEESEPLCQYLASGGGGIFLDRMAAKALRPYIIVAEQREQTTAGAKYGANNFFRLGELKIFIPTSRTGSGVSGNSGDFTPLFVRFGSGGLNVLTDSWTEWLRSLTAAEDSGLDRDMIKEINAAWEFLFRERLKDTVSPFAVRKARRFFSLLLTLYSRLARQADKNPVVILENIHLARETAADLVIESLVERQELVLIGTGELVSTDPLKWKSLASRLFRGGANSSPRLPELPPELWEIGYTCSLLGRYFPPDLFPRLFKEAGKNPAMLSRAISLLLTLKVIDNPLDPCPRQEHFCRLAEAALGERKEKIWEMVRRRLLDWVEQKKINPCIRLLAVLTELGGAADIDDDLILRSFFCELAGGDGAVLKKALKNRTMEIAGPARAPVLRYIAETLLALHCGSVTSIRTAFAAPPPGCTGFPVLRAQVLLNQSLYHLGLYNNDSAIEGTKEAILLCQKSSGPWLAQSYRLLALASLLRWRMSETIDYLGFALENAAKSGGSHDIGMAAYYAASVHLLYGNLSRSQILAEKAREHFLAAGSPEWADRSRFLEGRLAFEIGSYQQAAGIFEDIRKNPAGGNFPEKDEMLETWEWRARVCSLNCLIPRPPGGGYDTGLFELEMLCLTGNYPQALSLFDALSGHPAPLTGKDFFFTEQPDWRSGFAQCEMLCFSCDDLWARMLHVYHSLALGLASPAGAGEALQAIQQTLRGVSFPEIDPCVTFYHYAQYLILRQTGASQVDINTAVSAAYKRLQSRAARIEDSEIRRRYLAQPHWNSALEQAAKEFKLV